MHLTITKTSTFSEKNSTKKQPPRSRHMPQKTAYKSRLLKSWNKCKKTRVVASFSLTFSLAHTGEQDSWSLTKVMLPIPTAATTAAWFLPFHKFTNKMRTSTTATATHQQTDSAILRDSNAYHPTIAKPCTFSKTLKQEKNSKSLQIRRAKKYTNKQTKWKKKGKWSSEEPYMPQETTTKKRFEIALKYRDYKQLESSWLNSHSHFGLHRGRRTWSPLKVIPIPAPAALEAIMMRNCDVSKKCKRIWKAKQSQKTNKQINKPTKKTKEQSTRALLPNAYTISNNSLGTRPHFPNLLQT